MSLTDFLSLFLGCLAGGVILVCSSVALMMWRRGKRKPELLCARCLHPHDPVECDTDEDRAFKARLLEALEANARLRAGPIPSSPYGSSWPSAGAAAPPTAGTTAASTTPATTGSPRPDLDAPTPPIQHNPHSGRLLLPMCCGACGRPYPHDWRWDCWTGRIDASSRKQFGMCDYPD